MKEFQYLVQSIVWCSESMHDGLELADFLISKGIAGSYAELSTFPTTCRYATGNPRVLILIYDLWIIYAARRYVYLELLDVNLKIHPVVHPHLLSKLSFHSSPGTHSAAIGKHIQFNVWDGNNAPSDLKEWTGIVVRKLKSRSQVEYIIKRDADGELIKLTREYMVALD